MWHKLLHFFYHILSFLSQKLTNNSTNILLLVNLTLHLAIMTRQEDQKIFLTLFGLMDGFTVGPGSGM